MSDETPCPTCGEPVPVGANFCEACGAQLGEVTEESAQAGPKVERLGSVPISRAKLVMPRTWTISKSSARVCSAPSRFLRISWTGSTC